jgi:hypothetical protein
LKEAPPGRSLVPGFAVDSAHVAPDLLVRHDVRSARGCTLLIPSSPRAVEFLAGSRECPARPCGAVQPLEYGYQGAGGWGMPLRRAPGFIGSLLVLNSMAGRDEKFGGLELLHPKLRQANTTLVRMSQREERIIPPGPGLEAFGSKERAERARPGEQTVCPDQPLPVLRSFPSCSGFSGDVSSWRLAATAALGFLCAGRPRQVVRFCGGAWGVPPVRQGSGHERAVADRCGFPSQGPTVRICSPHGKAEASVSRARPSAQVSRLWVETARQRG